MNIAKLTTLMLLAPIAAFATGLSFQTLASTAGEIRTSSGGTFSSTTSASFGSISVSTSGFTSFSDYSDAFTSLGVNTFTATGDLLSPTTIGAGNIAAGTSIWLLIDTGTEQGAFSLGTTPSLGVLVSNPGVSTAGWGSKSGNNLLTTAVPEPSTYAMLAGALALGYVMIRRRK